MSTNNLNNPFKHKYLDGGGDMGLKIRSYNWADSVLGHPDHWPQNLLISLNIILNAKFPALLFWGPNFIQFYNDACLVRLGKDNLLIDGLGKQAKDSLTNAWATLNGVSDQAMPDGDAAENHFILLSGNGKPDAADLIFNCSRIDGMDGNPAGVLAIYNETAAPVKTHGEVKKELEEQQSLNEELYLTNEELYSTNEELSDANTQLVFKNEEIKLVEQQLKASEEKYRLLFQFGPLPKWIYDPETFGILDVNEAAIDHYGYSREEFMNMTIWELRAGDEIPDLFSYAKNGKKEKVEHRSGIFTHVKKNFMHIRVEVYVQHFNYSGKDGAMVTGNDVTEKEKAVNLLKEKEDKLRAVTEIARLGNWTSDLVRQKIEWSDEVYQIWGVTPTSFQVNFNSFFNTIHPEERLAFDKQQTLAIEGKKDFDFKHRIILPDGSVKWVHELGRVVKNEYGEAHIFQGTMQDITPQKTLELSLEESNQRFSYAARATSEAIWEWNCKYPEVFKEYGYKELFGYDFPDNVSPVTFWASKVHPDDYGVIWQKMKASQADTELSDWTIEYRFFKANNECIVIKEKAILLRDNNGKLLRMIGSMQDITRQKVEEQRLKLLESVITNSSEAVLITEAEPFDAPGPRIIFVNDAFTRITGYEASEVIGKTPRILQGPNSDAAELKRMSKALRNWESCEITIINYKKSGEEFWINFSVTPVADETGWYTHWIAIERDVSELKKKEAELKLIADDLYKRNKELQQFGYVVSHNLRSPVANIMGIANILEMDINDKVTVSRCIRDLSASVNRLDGVIRDLSKILSISDGSVELTKENIDLTEILNSVKTDLDEIVNISKANIHIPSAPHFLFSHKAYLYSVFYNLITNAIKYRSALPPEILVSIVAGHDSITINVSDNGIGIDVGKHIDDLFKPYKRFNSSVEGKGLGLFLVKSHIDALNGKIAIESEKGSGTSFKITLPINAVLMAPAD